MIVVNFYNPTLKVTNELETLASELGLKSLWRVTQKGFSCPTQLRIECENEEQKQLFFAAERRLNNSKSPCNSQ